MQETNIESNIEFNVGDTYRELMLMTNAKYNAKAYVKN